MSKNGKKTIYVNSNFFVENVDNETFNSEEFNAPISDSIRYFSSNFWTLEKNKLVKANAPAMFKINYLPNVNALKPITATRVIQ